MRAALALCLLAALGACRQQANDSSATISNDPIACETPQPAPAGAAASAAPAAEPLALDPAALADRKSPEPVLGYFARAVGSGQWAKAALAWRKGGMDGAKLKALLGGHATQIVSFGKGEVEGGAGSLYYAVPLTLIADDGQVQRDGTITLRRVNDVQGAADWQLAWHIEQIEWQQ